MEKKTQKSCDRPTFTAKSQHALGDTLYGNSQDPHMRFNTTNTIKQEKNEYSRAWMRPAACMWRDCSRPAVAVVFDQFAVGNFFLSLSNLSITILVSHWQKADVLHFRGGYKQKRQTSVSWFMVSKQSGGRKWEKGLRSMNTVALRGVLLGGGWCSPCVSVACRRHRISSTLWHQCSSDGLHHAPKAQGDIVSPSAYNE